MPKPTIDDSQPSMRAGERESRAGGEQYCLSPLPLPTDSEHAVDVGHLDFRHDDTIMDLRQGADPENLMTAGHIFSFGFMVMAILFLLAWAAVGGSPPPSQVIAFGGGGFI